MAPVGMTPEFGNAMLEQLRLLGSIVDVIHADLGSVKRRMAAAEDRLNGFGAQLRHLSARMDRFDERLGRVEPPLDSVESETHALKSDAAAKPRGTPLL